MLKKYFNILFVFLIAGAICVPIYAESVTSKRSKILDMRNEILTDLYSRIPSAKKNVQNAAGYATFSNFGLKIFVTGGGKGSGVAVNNKTKKHTYMKMIELQAGLGIGVKKFRQVWVFKYASDLNRFINSGWELSGQGTATTFCHSSSGVFLLW